MYLYRMKGDIPKLHHGQRLKVLLAQRWATQNQAATAFGVYQSTVSGWYNKSELKEIWFVRHRQTLQDHNLNPAFITDPAAPATYSAVLKAELARLKTLES